MKKFKWKSNSDLQEHDEDTIVSYVEEFLPMLEHADFIHKYSWWYSRYYEVNSALR